MLVEVRQETGIVIVDNEINFYFSVTSVPEFTLSFAERWQIKYKKFKGETLSDSCKLPVLNTQRLTESVTGSG